MNRRKSREATMKLLYGRIINKGEYEDLIEDFKENAEENIEDIDFSYVIKTLKGIEDNIVEIDSEIEKYLSGWKISRVSKVNLSILRLAIYEIKFIEEIPYRVAVNEAIELAKKYSDDKSPAFINGILGNMAK
ncbi:transcription antitermination factor NusB [Haloimpatiens lingqiaonensis]|uniref:transcription antitermination factor NusB n=1 Tax=Haloimpatiens lingqiaonensis TaxID=1380675 RepID=UPI0010FF36D5|nr:transcription antitermination factor NusB [Haloimpatiens lingqiaonensis]